MTCSKQKRKLLVLGLIFMVLVSYMPFATIMAYADTTGEINPGDTVTLKRDHQVVYGTGSGGYTNSMDVVGLDGGISRRNVYCTQPAMPTPSAGNYAVDKVYTEDSGKSGMLRKIVYYSPTYDGWTAVKSKYFSGFTEDEAYAVIHLAASYVTAGYDDNMEAWGGGSVKSYTYAKIWNKMLTFVDACKDDDAIANPPEGFKVFYITNKGYQNVIGGLMDKTTGGLGLKKESANTNLTDGNSCYSLADAQYGVYDKDGKLVDTLTTKADGSSNSIVIDAGTYTVKEIKASEGYALDSTVYHVTVNVDENSFLSVKEKPQSDPIGILLQKLDKETDKNAPQGSARLADAEYTILYFDGQYSSVKEAEDSGYPTRSWVVKTAANGIARLDREHFVSGDDFYFNSTGTIVLPIGTILVQETKAPEGYFKDDTIYVRNITPEGTAEEIYTYNEPTSPEQVYRGDLEFVKVSDGDLNRLADVPFRLTSKTTGESHVIVTDKNGYASTSSKWNKHTDNTNAGKTSEDGIWFGTSAPNDNKGALIYDAYTIEELNCPANEGMNLLKFDVTIYKDSVTVSLGTLTDDRIEIGTTAKDSDTELHMSNADEDVTIVDTVSYEGLKKGESYKLIGTLMDKETGKEIIIDGKPVTSKTEFIARQTKGTVEVEFTFNGTSMKGKDVVVFENLYKDGIKVATHADLQDEGQTISFPAVKTKAQDKETGSNTSNADEEVTIVDTVAYSNLAVGKEYTVKGILMNKATGKAILADGKEVTSEVKFKPTEKSGTIDVTFEFDGSGLKGEQIVVFESLYFRNHEVATHADITDKEQSIIFPQISTTAKDAKDGDKELEADKKVTIVDTVEYKNLTPGKEYVAVGVLMDKTTGKKLLVNGKEVTAETLFTAEAETGTVDVIFVFDGSALEGKGLVVFEKMYLTDDTQTEIAAHEDITDEGQTVEFKDKKVPPETPIKPDTPSKDYPQTGDNTDLMLWLGLALLASAGTVGVMTVRAHRRKSNESEVKAIEE